ncbi:MAG: S4 domain-containing protein [Candidatus Thorarchaeota archaeon]|jgi:23S rRNA (cytidine1920-2'-O)/16S rRNA (cytidine1409-2'-O)-methyltransferase
MPRLDVWLVEQGHFSSRQAAKRAIRAGHVKVNGAQSKPSKQIGKTDSVFVSTVIQNHPIGYAKLDEIDNHLGGNLLQNVSLALDIGSSAGGFLAFLGEKNISAIGIEVSDEFTDTLEKLAESYPTISILIDDAFTMDPSVICKEGTLDLLLVDVTTEPDSTLDLIQKFFNFMKKGGRLVAAFKSRSTPETIAELHKQVSELGFVDILDFTLDKTRQEIHLIAFRQ